jgi:hypothetical protein
MKKLALFMLVVTILLSACQASPAASPEAPQAVLQAPVEASTMVATQAGAAKAVTGTADVAGVWLITSHPHWKTAYLLLRKDGTYTFSPNPDGGKPSESGKYWFEDGQFLISDDFCPKPGKYTMEESGGENKVLTVTLVEDACAARVRILTGAPAVWSAKLP